MRERERERDPFSQNESLVNIVNGMTTEESVNVDRSQHIGERILHSMMGKSVDEFTAEAVTMSSRSAVKIRGETTAVDPQLIFQWLILVGE